MREREIAQIPARFVGARAGRHDADAEERQLESVPLPVSVSQMSGVVPPLGAVLGVRCRDRAGTRTRSRAARAGTWHAAEAERQKREPTHSRPYNRSSHGRTAPSRSRARFRTLAAEASIPIEADDLLALARRYADQGMYDESIHLYEMAEKLKPGSVALRINLARVRDLKKQAEESRYDDGEARKSIGERARDEIDSSQYVGLAQYYMAKDQTSKAIELLEIAKLKTPNNYRPFEILGRLYYSQGEWDAAHEEIAKARKLNPFDRGLAEISGRIEFELKNFDRVARRLHRRVPPGHRSEGRVDRAGAADDQHAQAHPQHRDEGPQRADQGARRAAPALHRAAGVAEGESLPPRVAERTSRTSSRRSRATPRSATTSSPSPHDLRTLAVFQHMKDEQIFRLSKFARVEGFATGDYVFREEDRSMDFYVVKDGTHRDPQGDALRSADPRHARPPTRSSAR